MINYAIYSKDYIEDFVYGSWSTQISWEKKYLGTAPKLFFLKSAGLGTVTLPLRIVQGLTDGVPLTNLVEVSQISKDFVKFKVENFEEPITLRVSFCDYLSSWKTRGGFRGFLDQFLRRGATNSLTVQHALAKVARSKAQEPPAHQNPVSFAVNQARQIRQQRR